MGGAGPGQDGVESGGTPDFIGGGEEEGGVAGCMHVYKKQTSSVFLRSFLSLTAAASFTQPPVQTHSASQEH